MILALMLAAAPILANSRVIVRDARAEPGPQEHDSILVELETGTARFVPKGTPLAPAGRALDIELLGPPVGPLPSPPGMRAAFDRPGIEKLFENDRVTVWRYRWQPGQRTPLHYHARDVVVTFLADGVIASMTPDGKTVLNPHSFGMVKFSPRDRTHQEELVKGEARAVLVELK
jgi:hypothetical protein